MRNGKKIINDELEEGMWEEALMMYFKVLYSFHLEG
jgi:hypothetical protein